MDNREAVNWLINISADIGKVEHSDLWHYERALTEIKDMLESIQPVATDTNVGNNSEIPNSSDAISRQQAIDIVVFECGKWTGLAKEISKQLKQLPTAQPEPHEGHWIEVAGELECSECHTVFTDLYPDYADSVACPHCGARMKGERQK